VANCIDPTEIGTVEKQRQGDQSNPEQKTVPTDLKKKRKRQVALSFAVWSDTMSIMQSCAYVPEMILEAPKELEKAEVAAQIGDCVGVAFLKLFRAGCIVTVRGGEGIVLKKKPDGTFSAPVALHMLGPAIG